MAGTPNGANIIIGSPDRVTSGAILVAPFGTALPTATVTAPNVLFLDLGYIDESGFVISQATEWVKITDWGGDQVRSFLSKFTGTVKFTCLETNTNVLKMTYGASNLTTTAPTVSTGTLQAIKLNAVENPPVSIVANILDGAAGAGGRKIRIVCPKMQITERGDLSFTRTDPLKWQLTGECYPDATGNSLYLYTDDGVFTP